MLEEINRIATCIDAAFDEKDEKSLRNLIAEINTLLSEDNCHDVFKQILYYDLGNAYSSLDVLQNRNTDKVWAYNNQENLCAIKAYRKCIKISSCEYDSKNEILTQCYTNIGNMFSQSGRTIYAINSWKHALSIAPDFGMTYGNLGISLVEYGKSFYDEGHADLVYKQAYTFLKKAVASKDVYAEAKNAFMRCKQLMESRFSSDFLDDKQSFPNYFKNVSEQESVYKKWLLTNTLFLNPLNDLYCESFVAHDVIHLPNIIMSAMEFPKYHRAFNEIKQQYVSARFMYYDYLQRSDVDKDLSDIGNLLIDTFDDALYGYKFELLRIAYKSLYSILDKIAFFINDYFKLGHLEKQITFNSIWYEYKQKDKAHIKSEIETLNNNPLRGLYYLSKDFFSSDLEYLEVADEDAQELAKLRNCLEHRYVKITRYKNEIFKYNLCDTLSYQISIDDFEARTEKLLHYVREAIIYLSLAVHINEEKNLPPEGTTVSVVTREIE